jgi:phosphoglycerate kinase
MRKMTIADIDVRGKRVLVRTDFNVPQDEKGAVTDDSRLKASLPTIQNLLERGARVVLMSHLGRPGGKPDPVYRMDPVAKRLQELLGRPVTKLDGCIEEQVIVQARQASEHGPVLLENLRFYPGEEKGNVEFANALARHGEVFVNDAFGAAHRAHASVSGIPQFLPAVAGLLMERELSFLSRVLHQPEHPYVAILGGSKVSDKLGVIRSLGKVADRILIGGAMANSFLKAKGLGVGISRVEDDRLDDCRKDLAELGEKLVLPVDLVVAAKKEPGASTSVVNADAFPADKMALDIGPASVKRFSELMQGARMVVWNGPMGVFELPEFAKGTEGVARAFAALGSATTVVGGGDSVAALVKLSLTDKVSHVSTGGGASLEFLEGMELPGVRVLKDKVS